MSTLKDVKNMTKDEMDILNNFMQTIIHNSEKCLNCSMCHLDDTCFFAFPCITNNFNFYREVKLK